MSKKLWQQLANKLKFRGGTIDKRYTFNKTQYFTMIILFNRVKQFLRVNNIHINFFPIFCYKGTLFSFSHFYF
jgi:hypothetical protein